jgi:hypothetical protein
MFQLHFSYPIKKRDALKGGTIKPVEKILRTHLALIFLIHLQCQFASITDRLHQRRNAKTATV